jgi:hypothetical protein
MRAGVHASTLAGLAQAYLQASDAHAIERLLQAGHHHQAAKRFCDCFSERQFPLEYAYSERGDLIVELTGGIQHEGYADNWEEIGDLWALKPVFLLSWALTEDPYGPLRDEFLHDNLPEDNKRTHIACATRRVRRSPTSPSCQPRSCSAYYREFVQLERLKKNSQFGANRTLVFG